MLETQHLKDFSIATWYEQFKDITLKAIIIELAPELLCKFRSDDYETEAEEICSTDYINQLNDALKTLNNDAFVKNNWHAPIDARFMSFGNTLKVTNISELILYFTSSDIVMNDFENKNFDSYCIVLRPWMNIHPASEFRCIVVNNVLRGISPRDWLTYYEHYAVEGPDIIHKISNFFKENIYNKFPKTTYIFDIFMTFPDSITLLDFGPLTSKTNLYAFNWREIQSIMSKGSTEEVAPVFRYLESDIGIMTRADALYKIT